MTTGEFASVRLDNIIVLRDHRTRREITTAAVDSLAESISRLGPIHPPLVTREGVLVSGETRVLAYQKLGWTHCTVQWSDTVDPRELLALELEENVKRTDLPWQDQCDALRRFHELQTSLHPSGWNQTLTAKEIGLTPAHVSRMLGVAEAIQAGDQRVIDAKLLSTASGLVSRKRERETSDQLASIGLAPPSEVPFLLSDFNDWAPDYDGPPFNFLHCDFPYGIGADKFNQGAAKSFGGYEDSEDTYWKLVSTLTENRVRLLGDSAHILFWFSMRHYTRTLEALKEFFWVDPYPLVWHKSDNKGTLPDPQRGPRRVYEVAFLCSWGDRKIISSVSNVFSGPTVRVGDHMSEKSEDALRHFFRMVCDENTRLLDPTCGSGSSLRAASSLGVHSVLGLEVNEEFYSNAVRAWNTRQGPLL